MYEFIDRLINIALPRVRDFRGLNPKSFDGRGNYTLGVKEHIVFPEIDYDKVDPYHIDLDKLDFKCSYVPPDYDSNEPLPQWYAPLPQSQIMDLETLAKANRNSFKWVSFHELRGGAMPKVIK